LAASKSMVAGLALRMIPITRSSGISWSCGLQLPQHTCIRICSGGMLAVAVR
jgi:hypothetical protein